MNNHAAPNPSEELTDKASVGETVSVGEATLSESALTRWELAVELRVNLLRAVSISVFYLVHLWNVVASQMGESMAVFYGQHEVTPVKPQIHLAVSLICLAWVMLAIVVHLGIAQRKPFGRWAFGVTLGDILCLTTILIFSTGPSGPMVAGYFLIILMAGMRHDLRLVWMTSIAVVAGYLVLLGFTRWPPAIVQDLELKTIPRYHQLMFILALVFAGVLTGQIVRLGWSLSTLLSSADEEAES